MGHFGRKAIGSSWLYARLSVPDAQLSGPGRAAARATPQRVDNPFYLMAPDWARLPLVGIATARDDHRQPGGDLRRLLGHSPGGPARLPAAPADRAHARRRAGPDLSSRPSTGRLLVDGHPARVRLPRVVGRLLPAYGIAVTGTMLITTLMLACRGLPGVEAGTAMASRRRSASSCSSTAPSSRRTSPRLPDGGWFPLLVGRRQLHRC